MDEEILNTVHSMFGSEVKIVDCVKSSSILQEETLMINGVPVKLDGMSGDDANAIKAALLEGQMPSVDLLNQLLYKAGLLRQSVQLETSLSIKSSTTTTEEVLVSRNGLILDERTSKTNEDYIYESNKSETFQSILKKDLQKLKTKKNNQACTIDHTVNAVEHVGTNKADTFSGNVSDKKQPLKTVSNSTSSTGGVDEYCDTSSTISNYSTSTFSDAATVADSSVKYLGSSSNFAKSTEVGDFNEERFSLSCDSGHDGIFHSVSQSADWPTQWRRGSTAANSVSSCYDIPSSSDEIFHKEIFPASKTIVADTETDFCQHRPNKSNQKYEYRKPQTHFHTNQAKEFLSKEEALVYCNGILVAGPLESLIIHLVPSDEYYPDSEFEFTFLLSARLLVPSHELLAKISNIWEMQRSQIHSADVVEDSYSKKCAIEEPNSQPRLKSARNIIRLLARWIELFPYDFRDERLMQEVRILTKKCIHIDPTLHDQVSSILQKLVQLLSTLVEYEQFWPSSSKRHNAPLSAVGSGATLNHSQTSPKLVQQKIIYSMNSINSNLHLTCNATASVPGIIDACPNPILLAHQLTAIELEHLTHIGPEEFLNAFGKEFKQYIDNNIVSLQSTKNTNLIKTRNLEAYVEWFDRLSYLTATDIVKCAKKKQRVHIVEYWIEAARECFNIGNFNSLMAILAGLNLSAVSRLKKTWSKVKSAKFSVLEHQMDPTSNFNSYRSTMKAAVWRSEGAQGERERLIIPFFTLFVKDLYFLNESCSHMLPNNNINFEKCSHFAQQVRNFNKWKQVECPYEKLSNVVKVLRNTIVFNEDLLSMASYACELPENAKEKECYKKLKSEIKLN